MKRYSPNDIEQKWQAEWAKSGIYQAKADPAKQKINASPMLPYPSGTGLHVGHVRNYSISDTVARYYRQRGFNVMSNIGWDAFGLPAENFAIKTGTPPAESTAKNIAYFKKQLLRLGISFDWSREINTSEPSYYKWTQWLFQALFKQGLAYQAEKLQWWCDKCKTVLADEQVVAGKCWRHDATEDPLVTKKSLKQWFFKITDYADKILESTDSLDWPEKIKTMQKNWIGRSEGAVVRFAIDDQGAPAVIDVFTTRPDTLFGATFLVMAPEHPLLERLIEFCDNPDEVAEYTEKARQKSELERETEKIKTGVVLEGIYALNPANNQKVPIWIADYVLMGYGTGAIMAVPAHDDRDNEFAEKYGLPVVEVIKKPQDYQGIYVGEGELTNSGSYSGMPNVDAKQKILSDLEDKGLANKQVNYRMRDWLISRQRYWGAPIPVIHCPDHGAVLVPEEQLPVVLPEVKNFAPDGSNTSVLAGVEDWVNVPCPTCGKPGKRETDTMDGYVCSTWYLHRYTDPHNGSEPFSREKLNYWFPVDFYFGGDHAVAHLLYVRFFNHVLADMGILPQEKSEPVKKLVFNGYINAEDGSKMSKSKGNTVDPMDIITSGYGADALRVFELFIAPYEQDTNWNTNGVPGTYRFLNRIWTLVQEFMESGNDSKADSQQPNRELLAVKNRVIKRVTDDMGTLGFNTAIAALMEATNDLYKIKAADAFDSAGWGDTLRAIVQLLAPFAPHITEELWQQLGGTGSVHIGGWPEYDEAYLVEDSLTIAVQINGKVRAELTVSADADQEQIVEAAKTNEKVATYLEGYEIKKIVFVPKKLVSFVV